MTDALDVASALGVLRRIVNPSKNFSGGSKT